jgi:hypothetical protein
MQVRGLPGHGIPSSRREVPRYRTGEKTRRFAALAPGDGRLPHRSNDRQSRRGAAGDALSLGEGAAKGFLASASATEPA